MAAQLYANTQLSQSLYEVLQELVEEEKLPESLAVNTLAQLDQSFLHALKTEIQAKADIKGNLDNYKYYDNVWQFTVSNASFKLNASGTGAMKKAPEVKSDKMKIVCVDQGLAN